MRHTGDGPFGGAASPRPALRLSGCDDGDTPPDQPIPAETLVLQRDDATYITRIWEDRDEAARNCRLCPVGTCRISPMGNCMIRVAGFVPTAMAALWPKATPGLGLAAVGDPGLRRDGSRA